MGGNFSRSSGDYYGAGSANGGHDLVHYKSKKATVETENKVVAPPRVRPEVMEKRVLEADDFYDGIPRFTSDMSQKSRSVRSTQAAVAKVSEASSRLGKADLVRLGKAVEVLDTLGSRITRLNLSSGFAAGVPTKGNELSILAFEVANTIVKGSSLVQSLSSRNTRHLKEVVLATDGVQNLISKDMDELLRIVEFDKREELKVFSGEVVRFGNRSKDPQWHNLERYFEKFSRDLTHLNQWKDEVESVVEQLMILVHHTVELYQELQVLDKVERDYLRKTEEEGKSAGGRKGDSLDTLRAELKRQRKQLKNLKKKSLWSRSLEEVMEKLVDIVHYLISKICYAFGSSAKGSVTSHRRLGPAGLALHYANIIMQIDTLVAQSGCIPANARDALYQSLPPSIKLALRSKSQSFHIRAELTVSDIKDEMEKTLQWLVLIATNTVKAYHTSGCVGQLANSGKLANGLGDVFRIETLYHADKEKTEAYILEQLLFLHYLVNKSKSGVPVRLKTSIESSDANKKRKEKRKKKKGVEVMGFVQKYEKL